MDPKRTTPTRLEIATLLLAGSETKVAKALSTAEALMAADQRHGPRIDAARAVELCRELMKLHAAGELLIAPTFDGHVLLKRLREFLADLPTTSGGAP